MLNTISTSAGSYLNETQQMRKKKNLMMWAKSTPELFAFLSKVARDIVSEYHFEPATTTSQANGKNRILNSNKFSMMVKLRSLMESQAFDMLGTGEGYGWIGKLDKRKAEKIIDTVLNRTIQSKEFKKSIKTELGLQDRDISDITGMDEDVLRPRKYRYVPSTTMEVIHDEYDVKQFNHVVAGRQVLFSTDEIVHYTLQDIDGKPYGFSPVESVLVQLELLRFMWQNMLAMHRNGGSPDKIISLETVQPGSPAYKRIEEQLKKYKVVENKHGNMLFTGKIQVEDLQQLEEMQFKEMGLYITGLVAMQWGIPRSAIPYIVGGTNTKSDVGGDAEAAYWRVIKHMQDKFSEDMNTQLWIPYFGTKLCFDNPYHLFNVQLETAKMTKLQNIMSVDQVLRPSKKRLSESKRIGLLGLRPDELEEIPEDEIMMQQQAAFGMGTQSQPKKDPGSSEQQARGAQKRQEQEQTIARQGKPSGVGKMLDWNKDAEVAYKEIIGMDANDVPFDTFIKVYNEDKAYHPTKAPRVFMRQNNMYTTFIFKGTDFVYRSVVPNEQVSDVNMMSFSGALYQL